MDGPSDKSREDELLVFGYACKLFRDDEKALFIDSGRHLIPWMADETLKIDRYDGRGALSDLRPHEPPPGGHDRWHGLTERERKLEEVVDQERYMALYKDEDEERMLEEEEWKRLQSLGGEAARYSQIGFSYGSAPAPGGGPATQESPDAPAVDDEPYLAPAALNVPDDMARPATRRHADIIERTALFVARQGPQMEILIRAKQSDNAMFDFLAFDDPLQPFFRHMVVMIKAGRFTVGPQKQEGGEGDEAYLHPALNLSRPDIAPGKTDGMYQSSANCAYQRLVKNIRSSRQAADSPAGSGTSSPVPVPATTAAARDGDAGRARSPAAAHRAEEAEEKTVDTTAGRAAEKVTAAAPGVTLPPADVKLIIDKMASYVAKNGRDFEGIVMGRGDERFSFLRSSHQHHAYYRQKLEQYERDLGKTKPASGTAQAKIQKTEDKANKPVPVSFSIRAKSEKESAPLERSALPLEESEEEGEGEDSAAQSSAAGAGEDGRENRQEKAPPSRPEPARRPAQRQTPIVAPAPGVGRDEIQLDRKRRAAQFLAKLRQDVDKIKQPMIGPQLPPGPLPSGPDSEDGGPDLPATTEGRGPPSPPAGSSPPPAQLTEEEESGEEADLDKYKLVDSDSPHSVPELGSDSGGGGAEVRSDSPPPSPDPRRSSAEPCPSGDDRARRASDHGRQAASRERSPSARRSRSGEQSSGRRRSRERSERQPDSRERGGGRRRASRSREEREERREDREERREDREERRRRHRHKKRSSHRRRRRAREAGSESEEGRQASRSPTRSRSRSPRRHKKRRKRPRSPPASYKRLLSSDAVPVMEEPRRRRAARPDPSRSPSRRKRKRSRSPRRHKHKSKKSKRSKRSRSRSASRSRRGQEGPEVTIIAGPHPPPAPRGDVIDLTSADSPERRLSQLSASTGDGAAGSPSVKPGPCPADSAEATEEGRADSTPRGASPTPVPSAVWSQSGSQAGSRSGSQSGSRSGSAASSRSGSPSDSWDRDGPSQPSPPARPILSARELEARRTQEAIAQLKQKLGRRRPPTNGAGAAAVTAVTGVTGGVTEAGPAPAERSSSALVAQMAEGLKAKVHEMMKGSLLGK